MFFVLFLQDEGVCGVVGGGDGGVRCLGGQGEGDAGGGGEERSLTAPLRRLYQSRHIPTYHTSHLERCKMYLPVPPYRYRDLPILIVQLVGRWMLYGTGTSNT